MSCWSAVPTGPAASHHTPSHQRIQRRSSATRSRWSPADPDWSRCQFCCHRRYLERYRSRDAEARRGIVGLQPKRADVILAGSCIVPTVMDKLGQQTLTVSDRGLRHGLLVDRFGG